MSQISVFGIKIFVHVFCKKIIINTVTILIIMYIFISRSRDIIGKIDNGIK